MNHPNQARDNEILNKFKIEDALKITPNGYRFSLKFKRALWLASSKLCAYCGNEVENHKSMNVDHFVPKSKGGSEAFDNYVCSCSYCNLSKQAVDMDEFRIRMSISKSPLKGIINSAQLKQLTEIGVKLPFEIQKFHFEQVLEKGVVF
ncbi:HNH endonuclease [Acinetobacter entericus]|uniref:HNH endonuclease n=1 Tax=Acinetobacter entericus TaxID=2989714 RepID=A0ABT3NNQ6_9GAMM|nr:HNH endonuclease signature motif containing protein [Acinetobacter entericus]MCW8041197.1 HNH endonuclease [Acinetobacter entericus]